MIPKNWRKPEEYDFCETLTSAQWAWEFLRRNPEYGRQWRAFHATWRELEAAYGKPPHRDFCAWKNDPRAWVPAETCPDGECRIDGDKVLIECALGARWGFYKFPPDPQDDDPVGEGRLVWRPRETAPLKQLEPGEGAPDDPARVALVFDLSLPLRDQLDRARLQLQKALALRRRQGQVAPQRVSSLRGRWRRLLQVLDAEAVGELDALRECWGSDTEALVEEAHRMANGGYLDVLGLPE